MIRGLLTLLIISISQSCLQKPSMSTNSNSSGQTNNYIPEDNSLPLTEANVFFSGHSLINIDTPAMVVE